VRIALYILWFIIPALYFTVALWAKLESLNGKRSSGDPSNFIKQGSFILACSGICVWLDQYYLEDITQSIFGEWFPLILAQITIFPFMLLIGAQLLGGSKPVTLTSQRIKREQRKSSKR
jgi:hypothetical protein